MNTTPLCSVCGERFAVRLSRDVHESVRHQSAPEIEAFPRKHVSINAPEPGALKPRLQQPAGYHMSLPSIPDLTPAIPAPSLALKPTPPVQTLEAAESKAYAESMSRLPSPVGDGIDDDVVDCAASNQLSDSIRLALRPLDDASSDAGDSSSASAKTAGVPSSCELSATPALTAAPAAAPKQQQQQHKTSLHSLSDGLSPMLLGGDMERQRASSSVTEEARSATVRRRLTLLVNAREQHHSRGDLTAADAGGASAGTGGAAATGGATGSAQNAAGPGPGPVVPLRASALGRSNRGALLCGTCQTRFHSKYDLLAHHLRTQHPLTLG